MQQENQLFSQKRSMAAIRMRSKYASKLVFRVSLRQSKSNLI